MWINRMAKFKAIFIIENQLKYLSGARVIINTYIDSDLDRDFEHLK